MRHLVLLGVMHFPGTDEQVKGKPTAATGIVKRQRGARISSSQPGKTTVLTISKIWAASIPYCQYCHCLVAMVNRLRQRFVTPCVRIKSPRLLVFTIHQL